MGKITTLLCMYACSFFVNTQEPKFLNVNDCNSELKVKKNRNVKSILPSSNLNYHLILTNNSKTKNIYKIDIVELQENCSNDNTSKGNVSLKLSTESNGEISLNAGQSYNFKVKVETSNTILIERWNCSEIKVTSLTCNELAGTVLLKTFVRDPSLR